MQTINIRNMTAEEVQALNLSFYTLCKWSDAVMLVDPAAIVSLWARGYYQQWDGILTLDELGNFVSFK